MRQYLNYSVLSNSEKDYDKRLEMVRHLCRKDGEVDTAANCFLENLNDTKHFTPDIVSAWQRYFEPLDIAATYVGAGLSDKQLARKEYDPERRHNTVPFSCIVPSWWEGGTQLDFIEQTAIENGFMGYLADNMLDNLIVEEESEELFNRFEGVEKQVAYLLCQSRTKTYIQRKLGLTKAQLATIIKHIGNKLRPVNAEPLTTKICRCCGVEKPIDEFHADKRNSDGRHCYCKNCVSSRKKTRNRSA